MCKKHAINRGSGKILPGVDTPGGKAGLPAGLGYLLWQPGVSASAKIMLKEILLGSNERASTQNLH